MPCTHGFAAHLILRFRHITHMYIRIHRCFELLTRAGAEKGRRQNLRDEGAEEGESSAAEAVRAHAERAPDIRATGPPVHRVPTVRLPDGAQAVHGVRCVALQLQCCSVAVEAMPR